jgi:hypothetical protein
MVVLYVVVTVLMEAEVSKKVCPNYSFQVDTVHPSMKHVIADSFSKAHRFANAISSMDIKQD